MRPLGPVASTETSLHRNSWEFIRIKIVVGYGPLFSILGLVRPFLSSCVNCRQTWRLCVQWDNRYPFLSQKWIRIIIDIGRMSRRPRQARWTWFIVCFHSLRIFPFICMAAACLRIKLQNAKGQPITISRRSTLIKTNCGNVLGTIDWYW